MRPAAAAPPSSANTCAAAGAAGRLRGRPRRRLRPLPAAGVGQRKVSPRSLVNTARRPPPAAILERRDVTASCRRTSAGPGPRVSGPQGGAAAARPHLQEGGGRWEANERAGREGGREGVCGGTARSLCLAAASGGASGGSGGRRRPHSREGRGQAATLLIAAAAGGEQSCGDHAGQRAASGREGP